VADQDVRVLVIDHVPLYREGVAQALADTQFRVVAQAGSTDKLAALVAEWGPDILLLEAGASPRAIAVVGAIMQECPALKVVALTASDSADDVAQALDAGFHGYILKGVASAELKSALATVHGGSPYITHELALRLLRRPKPPVVAPIPVPEKFRLTRREKEVLTQLVNGLTNREIASNLGVSVGTMKFYIKTIFRKLNVRNRVEALVKAEQMGLPPGGAR
jgi:DNA-binding NarL/FixJ family response regulator